MALFGNISKKKTGILYYLLLLIFGIIVLFIISYTAFRQNRALRDSTALVSQTQEIIREINALFGHYKESEAAGVKYLISKDSTYLSPLKDFQNLSERSRTLLDSLFSQNSVQQERLDRIPEISEQLYTELATLEPGVAEKLLQSRMLRERISRIEGYLRDLEAIKKVMITHEYDKLKKRREDYESEVTLTPITILYSSLFALGVLMFAFTKINSDRKRIEETQEFLSNILSSVQSIISYFEAVRDDSGRIIDFRIAYHNGNIEKYTGQSPDEVKNELISERYPLLFENGDFDAFVSVVESGDPKEFEKEYALPKGRFWFCNEVAKLNDGITIISQNVSLRKEAEEDLATAVGRLAVQNTVLTDAELAAGFGSFSHNLTNDSVTYSENCFRILGLEPVMDTHSRSVIEEYVLPEDLARLKQNTETTIKQKKSIQDIYCIKTQAGDLKNVMIQSHFFEKDGSRFLIGVLQDITREVDNKIMLQQRNRDLERMIAELDSFNRVVSHDLQEPLRKIQMFISRFTNSDQELLSEKGLGYLGKISTSANRMQLLIRNLLSYSQVTESGKALESVDLNLVFEKAIEDLSEKIKETKAQISVPELVSVQGIGFQLEQLFNNLLSNAIKYKKHDHAPEIRVTQEVLRFDEVPEDLQLRKAGYTKLTIADNGVGFDAAQGDKIFELFQRLHKKHAYEGTGLGLAICKKIVENHEGRITVESNPGEGTRMHVYLPYNDY